MWTTNDLRVGDRIYCKDWEDRTILRKKLADYGIYNQIKAGNPTTLVVGGCQDIKNLKAAL